MATMAAGRRAPARIDRALGDALRIIDIWLEYQRERHRIPGLSAAVVRGDRVVFERGYGLAVEHSGRRVTRTTCYRIASITKMFTATAVMQLVERGAVRLDERVHHYLPWFRSRRDARLEPITIRQLLSHTAGVERDGTDHWSSDRFPSLDDLKARARDGLAVLAPLDRWKYSNLGYAVLGQVVAAAGGRAYEDHVHEEIIKPLRLTQTGFTLTPGVVRALAVGYARERRGAARRRFPHPDAHVLRAAAGLVSNAPDLCAFMQAQFPQSGRLLGDLSKREMQRPQWQRGTDAQYGLGCNIWPADGRAIVGHGGGFQGFKTMIGMDPDRRLGVAILTNAIDAQPQPLMLGVFHTIQDCLARGGRLTGTAARRPPLARYEGAYAGRWGDLGVSAVDGTLLAYDLGADRPLAQAHELEPRGRGRFQIVDGPGGGPLGEMAVFEMNARGEPVGLRWGAQPMRRERWAPARITVAVHREPRGGPGA